MKTSSFIKSVKDNHKDLITAIAKLGYVSRGLVYLIIGYFATLSMFGHGEAKGSKSALSTVIQQPFGATLLWIVAVGLICYSLWRLIQSVLDTDDHGLSAKGFSIRAGLFISCITHLSLAWWAISLAMGSSEKSGGASWSAKLAATTGGSIILAIIAACILGAGFAHIFKGATAGFMEHFNDGPNRTLKRICQVGLITKGIAFLIISYLFSLTIFNSASNKDFGVEDALNFTGSMTYGWVILSAMGFGLFAFGFYSIIAAKYRRIEI